MNLVKAMIDWNMGLGNTPKFEAIFDQVPEWGSWVWKRHQGEPAYFSEQDGYVSFLYGGEKPDRGFAGRRFNLQLEPGTVIPNSAKKDFGDRYNEEANRVTLVGPWSGNAAGMNQLGFTESVHCSIDTNIKTLAWHGTFHEGHITLARAKELAEYCRVKLVKVNIASGGWMYIPARPDYPDDEVKSDWGKLYMLDLKPVAPRQYEIWLSNKKDNRRRNPRPIYIHDEFYEVCREWPEFKFKEIK